MISENTGKSNTLEEIYTELYLVTKKLSGVSWLIECQGHYDTLPKNQQETYWGIALIVEDLKNEIYKSAEKLERISEK